MNRGYEKIEPLVLPQSYHLYTHLRARVEDEVDDINNPIHPYTLKVTDDLTTMMSAQQERYNATNILTRLYMRQVKRGDLYPQEEHASINTHATTNEVTTGHLTAHLSPAEEATSTPTPNNQTS